MESRSQTITSNGMREVHDRTAVMAGDGVHLEITASSQEEIGEPRCSLRVPGCFVVVMTNFIFSFQYLGVLPNF